MVTWRQTTCFCPDVPSPGRQRWSVKRVASDGESFAPLLATINAKPLDSLRSVWAVSLNLSLRRLMTIRRISSGPTVCGAFATTSKRSESIQEGPLMASGRTWYASATKTFIGTLRATYRPPGWKSTIMRASPDLLGLTSAASKEGDVSGVCAGAQGKANRNTPGRLNARRRLFIGNSLVGVLYTHACDHRRSRTRIVSRPRSILR